MNDLLDYCPSIFEGSVNKVTFLKTLKFVPKDVGNQQRCEFFLYCDPFFEVSAYAKRSEEARLCMGRFSVISYRSATFDCTCIGQIIGIIKAADSIHLLVSRLIQETNAGVARKLPYPLFKYALQEGDSTRFTFEHVPVVDIISPCFYVPAVDQKTKSFTAVGKHHGKKEDTSYFYVLTQDRCQLMENLDYNSYLKLNDVDTPWDTSNGGKSCFNFNFFLNDTQKLLVRDVINA